MKLKEYVTPFFFGFIGIFAFAPFSLKPLIILSYAYLIKELSFKSSSTRQLIMWSIGHWGFGMSWLIVSVYYYGETSIAVSLIIFVLLINIQLYGIVVKGIKKVGWIDCGMPVTQSLR